MGPLLGQPLVPALCGIVPKTPTVWINIPWIRAVIYRTLDHFAASFSFSVKTCHGAGTKRGRARRVSAREFNCTHHETHHETPTVPPL